MSVAAVLAVFIEKVIRKNYKMFQYEMSRRKPLVKPHAVQIKNNFSLYFFLENFKKCPEKNTKTFRKIINMACFD